MPPLPARLSFMVRALRYRDYRVFFFGQIVSLTGTWMTNIAVSWLVYRLTGSATLLGVVGFAGQLPAFFMAPVAGIAADRFNAHKLLKTTQTLSMLQSFALAWFTLGGRMTIPILIALSALNGMINAFDMPARQVFVFSLIEDKRDLSNAIALNSTMMNAARLVGPAVGGLIVAAWGEGWCFLLDGLSFFAVLASLLTILPKNQAPKPRHADGALGHLKEGWAYTVGSLPIRSVILLMSLISLVGFPYTVLIPIFAAKVLGGGPHTLGLLMACSGMGAILGALWLASRRSVLGLGRAIPLAAGGFGASIALFALSSSLPWSAAFMLTGGFCFLVQMASSNTILQTIVDDDKRGRVMSFFMMAFLGTAPWGCLLGGALADRIGAPKTVLLGGLGCLSGALWFAGLLPALRESVLPIYKRMGILKEVAAGIESASEQALPAGQDPEAHGLR